MAQTPAPNEGVALVNFKLDDVTQSAECASPSGSDTVGSGSVHDELFFNSSGATITAGDLVDIDPAANTVSAGREVKTHPATVNTATTVGVAMETVVTGAWIRVRLKGLINQAVDGFFANVADAAVAGDPLRPAAVAGRLNVGVYGVDNIVAVCLADADASNDSARIRLLL
jgi:hypothetical protein